MSVRNICHQGRRKGQCLPECCSSSCAQRGDRGFSGQQGPKYTFLEASQSEQLCQHILSFGWCVSVGLSGDAQVILAKQMEVPNWVPLFCCHCVWTSTALMGAELGVAEHFCSLKHILSGSAAMWRKPSCFFRVAVKINFAKIPWIMHHLLGFPWPDAQGSRTQALTKVCWLFNTLMGTKLFEKPDPT